MKRKKFLKPILYQLIIITIFILPLSGLLAQVEDTTPAELVALDFTPKTIDVSTGPQDVAFTIRITDNLSGFDRANFWLYSPSRQQYRIGQIDQGKLISGDDKDGTYKVTVTFPLYSESGTWHIDELWMRDKVGNDKILNENDLIVLGFPTELVVVGGIDLLPPELIELSLWPSTIDVSTGPQDVAFTIRITENLSGFDRANFWLYSPSRQQYRVGNIDQGKLISGDDKDGTYKVTVTFPQYSESGTWHIDELWMRDKVGNDKILNENDLIVLGFPTELNVSENSPPVALCKDIEIPADENCQASIVPEDVDGGSYDPDDDPITLSVDNRGPFTTLGEHYVNLTVTDDSDESDTCQAIVTVVDTTPPIPDMIPLPTLTGECSAEITSTPTATDNCAGTVSGTTTDPHSYTEQGTFTVTWSYNDENGNIATQTQTVVVKDVTAPEISVSVNPDILRPPNHKMILITPMITVSDNCEPIPFYELTSISVNEGDETDTFHPDYDSTLADGHTTHDIQVDDDGNIYLRAERSGKGTGRTYTITYTATDASGNSATATATVTVPHDQK